MIYFPIILVDSSVLVAYYNVRDDYHDQARTFFEECRSDLLTTMACITEVMHLLSRDWRVQNQFLRGVRLGVFAFTPLENEDLVRISELNEQYADLPADFADLSLIAIAERYNLSAIATLDDDFNIYRRYQKQPFERINFI